MSPAVPNTTGAPRWRSLVVAALLLALLAGAVIALVRLDWPVEVVRIEGDMRYSDRERLEQVVGAHTRAGFFAADLGALRRDLRAMPWVRDASLRRIWPARFDIEIREHRAAAVWNEEALISERAVVFRPAEFETTGLPRLAGPSGEAATVLGRWRMIDLQLSAVALELTGLEQDARASWTAQVNNKMGLNLGREALAARVQRLVAAWPAVIGGERERIRVIDLRYPNGFAIAWRQDAGAGAEGEG